MSEKLTHPGGDDRAVETAVALAAALTESARALHAARTVDETLAAIVGAAASALPEFDHAGVTVGHRDGTWETLAASAPVVRDFDGLQYRLAEGPCLDALAAPETVVLADTEHEHRWPRYVAEATRLGLRAQLGVPLVADAGDEPLGGLNLYSVGAADVRPEVVEVARLFATHAAIALGRTRYDEQLHEALTTRKLIGQAVGIVMERYRIDQDRAFDFLTRASSTSNLKLRAVAEELVEAANRRTGD